MIFNYSTNIREMNSFVKIHSGIHVVMHEYIIDVIIIFHVVLLNFLIRIIFYGKLKRQEIE